MEPFSGSNFVNSLTKKYIIMKIPFVDLKAQYTSLKPELDTAINEVVESCHFLRGPWVDQFEIDFAGLMGVEHCVSCANGTDAILIALKALGVQPGDEVITTSHTWISTSEVIALAGARVVFCDTDPDTFNISVDDVRQKITSKTVGIIPVHLYGQAANMEEICAIAKESNLWVIEDCAQAHLAERNGKKVGQFGDVATYSFYPGKNLGAYGDAGCLTTNRKDVMEYATLFARHGGKGNHQIEGCNSRMDSIQAAVLNVKLPHLERWTKARQAVAARYDQLLSGVGDIQTPVVESVSSHAYHLYVIKTSTRDELMNYLRESGVACILSYPRALPFYQAYSHLGHIPEDFPNAYSNQSHILSIPIYPELTEQMQDYVVDVIKRFFEPR